MNIVRDTRERLGLSQGELAIEFGVTQSSISRLEKAAEVDRRTVLALEGLLYRKGDTPEHGGGSNEVADADVGRKSGDRSTAEASATA